MSVREEIEKLTKMRHVADGNTDAEHLEYVDKVADARNRISTPEDLAAFLRFPAVDMEKSSHPMEKTQWEFLMDLADTIDTDVVGSEGEKESDQMWSELALACRNSTS